MEPGTKKCSKCGEAKPLASFSKEARSADGKSARCKACAKICADLYFVTHKAQVLAASKVYRDTHEKQVKAYQQAYREIHLEEDRERSRAYASAHIEKGRARAVIWGAANRERKCATEKARRQANPEKVNRCNADRRARKLRACPVWADSSAIAEIYAQAQALTALTGIKHNVDHWVPLKSKLVSGLHVEFNLRVITKLENLSKGNRYWPDMP